MTLENESLFPSEEVFSDMQPLVRSVLDGYNVCIFAYGQTGSGKTFTMVRIATILVLRSLVDDYIVFLFNILWNFLNLYTVSNSLFA